MKKTRRRRRVALITGAASGIGAATARLLAEKGLSILCTDVRPAGASATAKVIRGSRGSAAACRLDVTSDDSWKRAMKKCVAEFGGLDVLVNAAGIAMNAPAAETAFDDWKRVMSVNLDGVFLGTKHSLALMLPKKRGAIINIASASGIRPILGSSAYSTSKAGVIMFTKACAREVAPNGIRVNAISPAGVKTPIWKQTTFFKRLVEETGSEEAAYSAMSVNTPMGRFAEPEEVAAAVWYLINGASDYVTGDNLVIDGGYTI